jgi:O-methyltransferase
MRRVLDIQRQREMLLTPMEAGQIFSLVQATAKLGGAMAEIGVYRGASARLIREADGSRPLHLFDTFQGLPETTNVDVAHHQGHLQKGQFACSFESVQKYLVDCDNVYFHQGIFPASANAVDAEHFSFVHSDVDIYESTKAVLEFFYPRMLPGGVIITHDFASCDGARRPFVEFFASRPEPVLELPGDQAMVVKLSSGASLPLIASSAQGGKEVVARTAE